MTQPPADTPAPLSGFQFRIHSGEHQATITDVGAKVRSYAVGGRNEFTPFGAGRYDLRAPRSARGLDLDDAYLDVLRDDDGLSWAMLGGPDGRTAAVWMDASMDTWQVCTGDHIDPAHQRTGLAAEPMSCIAGAFRTGARCTSRSPVRK